MILVLHNIRSVYNVGSIFRTADAAGVSRVILSGYTPTPVDRFSTPRKDFAKVSLGAEKSVPWAQKKQNLPSLIKYLRDEDFMIVALEQAKNAVPLYDFKPPKNKKIALVLGNEVRGLSRAVLKLCDKVVEIPMRGKKESLNVSVVAGVAMFALLSKKL